MRLSKAKLQSGYLMRSPLDTNGAGAGSLLILNAEDIASARPSSSFTCHIDMVNDAVFAGGDVCAH